jgi:hypothetical protein
MGWKVVMISRVAIAGSGPLHDVRIELGALNVVTGGNGSGKSSLYRSPPLLTDMPASCRRSGVARLSQILWAKPTTEMSGFLPEIMSVASRMGPLPPLRAGRVAVR